MNTDLLLSGNLSYEGNPTFGITFDFTDLSNQLVNIVDTVFVLLAICGVVIDHTTAGVSDSKLALTYNEPKEDYEA